VVQLRDVPADAREARLAETIERVSARRVTSRYLDPDASRQQVEEMAEHRGDAASLLDLVDDAGGVVGAVWVGVEGDELVLYDVVLEQAELAAELVPLLVDRASAGEMRRIGAGVVPGDAAQEAVASYAGFTVRATNMVLPLGPDLPGTGELTMRPMTQAEYEPFMAHEEEGFARELAAAGMDLEQARERSHTMMGELLPEGRESAGMEFHVGEVSGEPVGDLWLATGDTMAFVYNIVVRPEQRRRGYGAGIMRAAALRCRDLGNPVLGLNVFAHNPSARALYDKLGYRVTHDYYVLDVPDAG
jgi:GNAT superfamily N-acetyltransferase